MQDKDNFLFYPFIKKKHKCLGYDLDAQYYDISGAYGYNGRLGKVSDPQLLWIYSIQSCRFLKGSGVVTEFTRYCPITGNRNTTAIPSNWTLLDNVFSRCGQGLGL